MANLQSVKGTRDLLPETWNQYLEVQSIFHEIGTRFGFDMAEIPIIEFTKVFSRSLGDTTDIVTKEMYTFEDKGGDSITMRPEGTAGLVRAFLSNGLTRSTPVKFLYSGPMFRYERPQKGRYRQFYQLGAELIGASSAQADLEVLSFASLFLKELGLADKTQLELNSIGDKESRQNYRDKLVEYFSDFKNDLSRESLERLEKNPMRILDSKQEEDQKLVAEAPKLLENLNSESLDFFNEVCEGLKNFNIDYTINHKLVRGLDYYCHTVFEFTTQNLGSQNAVLSGGRYDELVSMMGGPATPGIGFAAGTDRLVLLRDQKVEKAPLVVVIPVNKEFQQEALQLSNELRKFGLPVEMSYSGNLSKRLTKAQKMDAHFALMVSKDESGSDRLEVKDLKSGEQKEMNQDDFCKLYKAVTP